jgi:thiazole synthase ThiGH ThiG subunit
VNQNTILEVSMSEAGVFTYKLRETNLTTKSYAQLLVALASDIASMFETASGGRLPKEAVYAQICQFMQESFHDNPPSTDLGMLQ